MLDNSPLVVGPPAGLEAAAVGELELSFFAEFPLISHFVPLSSSIK